MKYTVANANAYIAEHAGEVGAEYRMAFHAMPPIGWINDPNGMCYYNGRYHLFGQFHPYSPYPGPMHWAHWVSDNMLDWCWVSTALAPENDYDNLGVWSGTALPVGNELYVMYTGVHNNADGVSVQEQCMAKSQDGVTFEKCPHNPILRSEMLPKDASIVDFRDPKLFRVEGGYRVIAANRGCENGRALSFFSPDLQSWRCDGVFTSGIGEMPECPDYFTLDGKDVLVSCVMGMPEDPLHYPSTQPSAYIIGTSSENHARFAPEHMAALDNGHDFYAPQTLLTPDDRRVLIGWMPAWPYEATPTQYLGHGWMGAMSLPRELRIENGVIKQRPIRELTERFISKPAEGWAPQRLQITLLKPEQPTEIRVMESENEYFLIAYDPQTQVLSTDRTHAGHEMRVRHGAKSLDISRAYVPLVNGELSLDIFIDRCSVEIFVNDGAYVLTNLAFPKRHGMGMSFDALSARITTYHS